MHIAVLLQNSFNFCKWSLFQYTCSETRKIQPLYQTFGSITKTLDNDQVNLRSTNRRTVIISTRNCFKRQSVVFVIRLNIHMCYVHLIWCTLNAICFQRNMQRSADNWKSVVKTAMFVYTDSFQCQQTINRYREKTMYTCFFLVISNIQVKNVTWEMLYSEFTCICDYSLLHNAFCCDTFELGDRNWSSAHRKHFDLIAYAIL